MAMAAVSQFSAISSSTVSSSSSPSVPKLSVHKRCHGMRICSPSLETNYLRRFCVAPSSGIKSSSSGSMPLRILCSTVESGSAVADKVLKVFQGCKIIFVAAEVTPWSKTGGLGDVMAGLAAALAARGHDVMTVAPRYDQYFDCWDTGVEKELLAGDKLETVRYFHTRKRGVDRVFVDHPFFLAKVWGKTGSKIYGPETGKDYLDNQLRFSLFAQAAIEAALVLNLNGRGPYGENVIFVANDWHSALVPCYLKANYKSKGRFKNAKVAFCIHNIAYQGRFALQDFSLLNLPDSLKSSFDFIDGYDVPVKGRKINWMKAGISESDILLTVSPNYALEIVSGMDRGVELDTTIQKKPKFKGIINGMDTQEWDPSADKFLEVKYDSTTVTEAKAALKEILQAEVGLPVDPTTPILGFIGRLEEQKGSDILAAAVPEILKDNVQLIVLGTGKKIFEKQLEELEVKYPTKARGVVKFSPALAHLITAAADFMVVPSRFEPCGLIQLHAMRYGTIPIVASTGGLVDTVEDGVTGFHVGKAFNVKCEELDPTDVEAFATTVHRAVQTYGTPIFTKIVQACMAQDLSWKGPAKEWEEVLLSLQVEGSKPGVDGEEIAPNAKENVPAPTAPKATENVPARAAA